VSARKSIGPPDQPAGRLNQLNLEVYWNG